MPRRASARTGERSSDGGRVRPRRSRRGQRPGGVGRNERCCSTRFRSTQLTALAGMLRLSIAHWPGPLRWTVYHVLTAAILALGNRSHVAFIPRSGDV